MQRGRGAFCPAARFRGFVFEKFSRILGLWSALNLFPVDSMQPWSNPQGIACFEE